MNGIKHLKEKYPRLIVSPVETLTNKNKIFHENSACFADDENSNLSARHFYYEMVKEKGLNFEDSRRGYGSLELGYAFSHGTPDNCLPIFWHDEDGWNPLFKR